MFVTVPDGNAPHPPDPADSPDDAGDAIVGVMRPPRTAAVLTASALLGAGAAALAAGRRAGMATLRTATGEGAEAPAGFARSELTVHAVEPGRITLTRTLATLRPGVYGLVGAEGRVVIGPVLERHPQADTVTRRTEAVSAGELRPGARVGLTPQLYAGDPATALGLPGVDVRIPGELGPLPAWYLPGARDTWVIALHGLGTTREHAMNLLPFLYRNRFPALLPAYRGDPGAPPARSGLSTLGATEWHDADAALRYAVRFGARRVLLIGWSTGATMALLTAARSALRERIAGLVLDSPVLDRPATLRALARDRGVPALVVPLAAGAAEGGLGLAPADPPDLPARPGGRPLPALVLHGPGDTIAPWGASRGLVERHPESALLHRVDDAEHAAMWNADPAAYEEALRRFATPLS